MITFTGTPSNFPSRPVIIAPLEVILLVLALLSGVAGAVFGYFVVGLLIGIALIGLAVMLGVWRIVSYILILLNQMAPAMRKMQQAGLL